MGAFYMWYDLFLSDYEQSKVEKQPHIHIYTIPVIPSGR